MWWRAAWLGRREVLTCAARVFPSGLQIFVQPYDAFLLQVCLEFVCEVPTGLPLLLGEVGQGRGCCVLQRVEIQAQVVATIIAVLPMPGDAAVILLFTAVGELQDVRSCPTHMGQESARADAPVHHQSPLACPLGFSLGDLLA